MRPPGRGRLRVVARATRRSVRRVAFGGAVPVPGIATPAGPAPTPAAAAPAPAVAAPAPAVPAPTPAPARSARLTYARSPNASDCPEPDVIRAGVAARLGYEPFDDRAQRAVLATVNRTGRTLEALIQIAGADGKPTAERKLVSHQSDCGDTDPAIA